MPTGRVEQRRLSSERKRCSGSGSWRERRLEVEERLKVSEEQKTINERGGRVRKRKNTNTHRNIETSSSHFILQTNTFIQCLSQGESYSVHLDFERRLASQKCQRVAPLQGGQPCQEVNELSQRTQTATVCWPTF